MYAHWFGFAAMAILVLAPGAPVRALDAPPVPRPAAPEAPVPSAAARALFAMPAVSADLQRMAAHVQTGDLDGAVAIVDALRTAHPDIGLLAANRAALHMLAGETEAAITALEDAVARGFRDMPRLLVDPLFATIAEDPRLASLEIPPMALPEAVPAPLTGTTAPVNAKNTVWDQTGGWLRAQFDPAPLPRNEPVLGRQQGDAAYDRLRDLYRLGQAAGNHGDLYDNRDRGHSALPADNHPQISRLRYGEAARANDIDYGLNDRISFNLVTLGNSSTALTSGPFWRSQPRHALTRADGTGPARLFEAYASNQIYVYPSHRDHTDERGDLFPANTPYMIVSQGSSGSDRPFLEAVAMILAAFQPETKARLVEEGLIAPTVQFVFRRSQRSVLSREDYFSGLAHPSVFPAYEIGLARMVSLANAITPDAIPPMVRLGVLEEDLAREGLDFFGRGLSEQFFDTPSAIGRVWRGRDYTRTMVISAEDTVDPNDRPLTFHWRLLRGDPDRVRITPLGNGERARIEIDWQAPRPVAEESPVLSARVDIGVFAKNGVHDSAPAILSMLLPAHETRRYEAGPDGEMHIAAIDYADPDKAKTYADPMLMARAGWRDEYVYDAEGRPVGWTRIRPERTDSFDAAGRRILTRDAEGRPDRTEPVAYTLERSRAGGLEVREVSGQMTDGAPAADPAL